MPRKYSVSEIDRMREIVRRQFPQRLICHNNEVAVRDTSFDAIIEARLHTYTLAGVEPDELEEELRATEHPGEVNGASYTSVYYHETALDKRLAREARWRSA